MRLSDICLSVAYIEPKSTTERPRKTKIGKEVAHVTRDSDTTVKVKVTRPLCSPPCWRIRRLQQWAWNVLAVGNCCYVAVGTRRFGTHGEGEGRGHIMAAACPQVGKTEMVTRTEKSTEMGKSINQLHFMSLGN